MGQSENTAGVRWKMLKRKAILKTWPATPVESVARIRELASSLAEVVPWLKEQPGSAGHPEGLGRCQTAEHECLTSDF
jgi:hypothetical protein